MSNWYEDSILLLEEAEEILDQIKQIEIDSVQDYDKLKRAQPKIKNFLDNCRAPLDYLAVYLRNTYTNNKHRVYFPFAYNQQSFNKRIKNDFKNKLPAEVVSTIISFLPFCDQSQCLGWLNILTNENKHQKLSCKRVSTEHNIKSANFNNIKIVDSFIGGFDIPIQIEDTKYDLINSFPSNKHDISSKYILIFDDYDLQVIDLLTEIIAAVKSLCIQINNLTINKEKH